MTYEEIKERVYEHLSENLTAKEIIAIHNHYCDTNSYEDHIYNNDEEFFEIFFPNPSFRTTASLLEYSDYNLTHDYVQFNGYGNLESFNAGDIDNYICYGDLAKNIVRNLENYRDMLEIDFYWEIEESLAKLEDEEEND